jgi:hypothetical protein
MMRRHLTGNEAAQAVGMLQAGKVQRAIAGHFNVSQSVISIGRVETAFCGMSQACSIGFMSGEQLCHSIRSIVSFSR